MGLFSSRTNKSRSSRDNTSGVLILTASEIRQCLTAARCLTAVEEMYANLHANPEDRGSSLGFETADGKIHVKSGLSPKTHKYFAAKINANYPNNASRFGLPTIQGLSVLIDCSNGSPLALLQSGVLTGIRTAAATALAAKHGARKNSKRLAIIGCGEQANYQAEAVCGIRDIDALAVFDKDRTRAKTFAAWAKEKLKIDTAISASVEEAARASHICVTGTTSTRAILAPGMVPAGCFVAAVGADNPDKQEIDPALFVDARIIVDDIDQCFSSGDLAHAQRAGVVIKDDVDATLAQLAAGAAPGRINDDEIVIFDSTGVGVQDVAASAAAFETAREKGIGFNIDLSQ